MIFLLGLGVPIAYLVVLITLLVRRDARGVALSVLLCVASIATGIWAIDQSRSSTAGIAFLAPRSRAIDLPRSLPAGSWRGQDWPSRCWLSRSTSTTG